MAIKKTYVCNVHEEGRFGGPQRRTVLVSHALKSLGVETCVVYPRMESGAFQRYMFENDIVAKELDITRLSKQKKVLFRYVLRFVVEIINLSRLFRKEKFDLVHVNGSYQFKVAIAAKFAKIPVVWHLNDTYAPSLVRHVFDFVAKRCASGFIVAGERVHEYYLSGLYLGHLPWAEIHAPVDLKVFNSDRFVNKQMDRGQRLRIGTVSSVNPAKGLEYFVEMAAGLLSINPNIDIIVAGSILESQRAYFDSILEKMSSLGLTKDSVQFLGLVEDVPAFLNDLDICAFTSVTEASPTSVWEAMAMAKPVVTTDAGAVGQYIENGVSGFVVPVADIKQLVCCVEILMTDELLRNSLGAAAREVAVRSLSIEAAADHHASIYSRIIEHVGEA